MLNDKVANEQGSPNIESGSRLPILSNLSISAPCSADWNSMTGDDKKRFCSLCNHNVFNVSAMRPAEAEAFLSSQFGKRVCVKYYKRRDGTLISQNCPIGLRQLRRQGQKLLRIISSL